MARIFAGQAKLPNDSIPLPQPRDRQLDRDVACRKCKYDLRGLAMNSRCPECGTLVAFSLRGDLLRFSDPSWVAGLGSGMTCILWGVPATVIGWIISHLIYFRDMWTGGAILSVAGAILHFYGAWLLTVPDPSGLGEDRYGVSRKLIRVTLLIGMLQNLFNFLAITAATLSPRQRRACEILQIALALTTSVGLLATLNYLGKLARRISDEALAARAEQLIWEIAIPLGAVFLISWMARASDYFSQWIPLFGCLLLPGAVGAVCAVLVICMRYLVFLTNLGSEFRDQAERAEQAWTAPCGHL